MSAAEPEPASHEDSPASASVQAALVAMASHTHPPGTTAGGVLGGRQILVVDDDKSLLHTVAKVLRSKGAGVLAAGSVSAAVFCLTRSTGPLDLVITDLRLPVASGRLILSAMRTSARQVPAIVMTAYATPALRDECLALGADAFIEKPFDATGLLAVIHSVLHARATRADAR